MNVVRVEYDIVCDRRTCSAGSLPSNSENEKFPPLFSPFTRVKDEPEVSRLDPIDAGIAR